MSPISIFYFVLHCTARVSSPVGVEFDIVVVRRERSEEGRKVGFRFSINKSAVSLTAVVGT